MSSSSVGWNLKPGGSPEPLLASIVVVGNKAGSNLLLEAKQIVRVLEKWSVWNVWTERAPPFMVGGICRFVASQGLWLVIHLTLGTSYVILAQENKDAFNNSGFVLWFCALDLSIKLSPTLSGWDYAVGISRIIFHTFTLRSKIEKKRW